MLKIDDNCIHKTLVVGKKLYFFLGITKGNVILYIRFIDNSYNQVINHLLMDKYINRIRKKDREIQESISIYGTNNIDIRVVSYNLDKKKFNNRYFSLLDTFEFRSKYELDFEEYYQKFKNKFTYLNFKSEYDLQLFFYACRAIDCHIPRLYAKGRLNDLRACEQLKDRVLLICRLLSY